MNISVYLDYLEALSIRERFLIGATAVGLIVTILQFFLVDPMFERQQQLAVQLKAINTSIERQTQQLEFEAPMQSRQKLLLAEIKNLEHQVIEKNESLNDYAATLVPADKMPALLQALLDRESVDLVSLVNLPPVALIEMPSGAEATERIAAEEKETSNFQLYRHGIQLELRGDFHTLRQYLVAIELQSWKLIWQSVRFRAEKNGSNVMELHLQTLSTDSAWLGV
mgnify:FL=1